MSDDASDREALRPATRQSPIAVVFIGLSLLRRIGLINLGVVVAFALSGRLSIVVGAVAAVIAVVLAAATALSWWRFTFCVSDDELVVTKGVVTVERLVIPLDRVQSVAIDQTLLHRMVGLVKASVDTAGADGAEFTIDAVNRSSAEALQRLATEGARAPDVAGRPDPDEGFAAPAAATDEVLIRRTLRELVVIGATSVPWAGLLALVPLLAFADEIGGRAGLNIEIRSTAADSVDNLTWMSAVISAVALVLAATAIGVILQVARSVLADWDMTLVRSSSGLRRRSGLLNTTSTASTIRRVQSFDTHRSPIQRRIGIRRLTLETIGAGDIVVPGTTDDEIAMLRRIVFGHAEPAPLERSVSRWIVFLQVRKAVVVALGVAIALAFTIGPWAAVATLWIIVSWAVAERGWRLRRWGYDGERLAEHHRVVSETTREIQVTTAQAVTLRQSFFERRRGLASVIVDTASSSLKIPLIDVAVARNLRDQLLVAVESSARAGL